MAPEAPKPIIRNRPEPDGGDSAGPIPLAPRLVFEMPRTLAPQARLILALAVALVALASAEASEKRIVVAGLNAKGHLRYAFRGEGSLILVETSRPTPPKTLRLTNRSGRTLRIELFNGGDSVRLIPRQRLSLANGKSHEMPYQVFHTKAFELGLLNKLAATGLSLAANAEIRPMKGSRRLEVHPERPAFQVRNLTKESFQVSIFNESDRVRAVPLAILNCPPQKSTRWDNPRLEPFRIRVHPNKVLTRPVSDDRLANALTQVEIRSVEWSPWKTLNQMKVEDGRIRDSSEPLIVPGPAVSADSMGYTTSGRGNFFRPFLYARNANGQLWSRRLLDSPLGDGLVAVERSADWRLREDGGGGEWDMGPFSGTPVVGAHSLLAALSAGGALIAKPLLVSSSSLAINESGKWTTVGGRFEGNPAFATYGNWRDETFLFLGRDPTDQSIRAITRDPAGKWGEWQDLGRPFQDRPAACTLFEGSFDTRLVATPIEKAKARVHIFARGPDDSLMHRVWIQESGWKPWEKLEGKIHSSPSVLSEKNLVGPSERQTFQHRIHLVAKDAEGRIRYWRFDGKKWSAPSTIGPALASDPILFLADANH